MARKQRSKRKGQKSNLNVRLSRLEQAIEVKYHDTSFNGDVDYDGDLVTLNSISQGDTDTTRDGDALNLKSLSIHYELDATSASNGVRIIIFKDHQNSISAVSDVMASTGLTTSYLEHAVWDNRRRYKVIFDRIWRLDAVYSQVEVGKINVNLKGLRTQYLSGTTTITTGALKMILLSNVNPAGVCPTGKLAIRLTFKDL